MSVAPFEWLMAANKTAKIDENVLRELLGCSRATWYNWKSGKRKPLGVWSEYLIETATAIMEAKKEGRLPLGELSRSDIKAVTAALYPEGK